MPTQQPTNHNTTQLDELEVPTQRNRWLRRLRRSRVDGGIEVRTIVVAAVFLLLVVVVSVCDGGGGGVGVGGGGVGVGGGRVVGSGDVVRLVVVLAVLALLWWVADNDKHRTSTQSFTERVCRSRDS